MIDKKILNILFDNRERKIDKKYTIENNKIIVNQSDFVEIEKNKQIEIDFIEIDKNTRKQILDIQILNINKTKTCEYIASENREKFCKF